MGEDVDGRGTRKRSLLHHSISRQRLLAPGGALPLAVVREDPWYRVMPGLTCFVWAAEPRAVAYTLLFSSIHDPLLDNGRLLTTAAAL